jgi:hypothetical protein
MRHLADEFRTLARSTPVIDQLYPRFDPQAPEGRAEIPMRWGGVVAGVAVLAAAVAGGGLLMRRILRRVS